MSAVADALASVVCPDTVSGPDMVRAVAVVVARVEVPFAVRVPCVVSDEVAVSVPPVIDPAVRDVKNEVTPCMIEAIRPVVVVVAVTFMLLA